MVTDAAVAGTIVDGVIVVARMGSTHRASLRRAVEELQGVGARLLGIVLNDVHHTEDRYGSRYAYAYQYHDEDGTDGAGDRDGKPAARAKRGRGTPVLPAIWAGIVGVGLACAGSAASAQQERQPPSERASTAAAARDTNLTHGVRPGDVVRIWIWREPDLSGEFPIDPRGTLILPLLGALEAGGKTGETLTEELRSAYARYLKNPSVQVTVLRRVAVQGLVANPGFYPVDATVSIAEVIALAGGIAPSGDPGRIRLVRAGRVVVTRLGPETVLERSSVQSGDVIYVPEKGWLARNGGTLLWAGVSVAGAILVGTLVR
jgi:polysaccharide biosynthesis/export protein